MEGPALFPQVRHGLALNILAFIPTVILGIIGGLLGAMFTFINIKVKYCSLRYRRLTSVLHMYMYSIPLPCPGTFYSNICSRQCYKVADCFWSQIARFRRYHIGRIGSKPWKNLVKLLEPIVIMVRLLVHVILYQRWCGPIQQYIVNYHFVSLMSSCGKGLVYWPVANFLFHNHFYYFVT